MPKCRGCGAKGLFLKLNSRKLCMRCLSKEVQTLEAQLTPEMKEAVALNKQLEKLNEKLKSAKAELDTTMDKSRELKNKIIQDEEYIELESFALYRPRYAFTTVDEYKSKLESVRLDQKQMIKNKTAVTAPTSWVVNNSASEGRKMTNDFAKLLLRAFNNECEVAIANVKFNTFDRALARIEKSFNAINTLGRVMEIKIGEKYLKSKIDELHIAFEYEQKKEEEKQALRELREQQREEARAAKELEEARKETEKEKTHYQLALTKALAQLETTTDDAQKEAIQNKIDALNANIEDVNARLADIDYRQANQKAGYVYVISNIGAFGNDVFKIGMTRRLDPYERVRELGDASVPFYFDVHAMIFSKNAPKLEAALHQAFSDRRINKVNYRKEYFQASLQEIKKVIRENHDNTVEYSEVPEAKEYRESIRINHN